jgi:next-to-BRCA1 protein 1
LHNKTHPLIKFKTPVNGVSVCTLDERAKKSEVPILGDLHARSQLMATAAAWMNTAPVASSSNAATQVQTVADVKPSTGSTKFTETLPATSGQPSKDELDAHFVSDTIKDGTVLLPNFVFTQLWTLRNPGPTVWPKGSSVKFVGGDNMRNIDMGHPISVAELEKSVESNRLPVDVEVGDTWQFSVSMKTPRTRGKYISYWRLTAPDGRRFGHRLWCEVDVSSDANLVNQGMAAPAASKDPVTSTTQSAVDATATKTGSDTVLSNEADKVEVDSSLRLRKRFTHDCPHFWTDDDKPHVEHIEDVSKEHSEKSDLEKSALVFPTLEKEIPANEVAHADEAAASGDEAEEIAAEDEDGSDDEFLTDEEYDVLDASDV